MSSALEWLNIKNWEEFFAILIDRPKLNTS